MFKVKKCENFTFLKTAQKLQFLTGPDMQKKMAKINIFENYKKSLIYA